MPPSAKNLAQPWKQWHQTQTAPEVFDADIEDAVALAKGGNAGISGYMAYRGPTEPCNLNQTPTTR